MKKWRDWKIETIEKKDLPDSLKKLKNAPEKLFYRGEWDNRLFDKSLAIVGSRRMTRYGREVVEKFMPEIVAQKTTVVSGFMYGVDTEAHRACVDLGGKTVAVLGGGVDRLTPVENDQLYSQILASGGLVISEYEPDFWPTLWSFPQRNRLVAALASLGVLIIEAGIKSGSLITAKLALKQKKKVLAVPGPINSSVSAGTNWLIKNKAARMVTESVDIFGSFAHAPNQESLFKDYSDLSAVERQVIAVLETEAVTVDELCQKTGIAIAEMSTAISMMLMRDLITEENGKIYLS